MLPVFSASSCSSLALLSLHHQVQTPRLQKQHSSAGGMDNESRLNLLAQDNEYISYFIGDS
jgi:hypothetical protein